MSRHNQRVGLQSHNGHTPSHALVRTIGLLLDASKDNSWRNRINDPLPEQNSDGDSTQRLRDTVRDLNRSLGERVVRFRGDGTGKGVTWEHVCP